MLTPAQAFIAVMVVLVSIWVADRLVTKRRRRILRQLAIEHRLRYSALDRFNLAERLSGIAPPTTAGDLRVRDVMYRSIPTGHMYILTAESREGTIRGARVVRRLLRVAEGHDSTSLVVEETVPAETKLSLKQQYLSLAQNA